MPGPFPSSEPTFIGMTLDTTSPSKLRVAVIGSGIAGLAAAAFLRKLPQFIITVYELRSADCKESSAALGLQTNGTSIVEQLGITREEVRGVIGAGYRTYNIREEPMSTGKVAFPADGETGFWFVHRQDLKDALLRRVVSEDEEGEPIQVVYDCQIVEIDPEAGMVKFANRSSVEMDLIIGKSNEFSYVTTIELTFFCHRRRWHPLQSSRSGCSAFAPRACLVRALRVPLCSPHGCPQK